MGTNAGQGANILILWKPRDINGILMYYDYDCVLWMFNEPLLY